MSTKDWWEDTPIHHVEDEYEWAYDDEPKTDEEDESAGADDYTSSRPWGLDNDG